MQNQRIPETEIERIKALPIADYLTARGLKFHGSGNTRKALCPFHDERTPSFTIDVAKNLWHCFGCGAGGDLIALEQRFTGALFADAARQLRADTGEAHHIGPIVHKVLKKAAHHTRPEPKPKPPADFHRGTRQELQAVARLRCLSEAALSLADKLGLLRFGTVCGYHSWIVTDKSGRIMEARRMDDKPFPAFGTVSKRKSHALKNSAKCWPVGIASEGIDLDSIDAILVCEGMPDLLAGLHFIERAMANDSKAGKRYHLLPVAILGRCNATLHNDALARFRGKRVRIYPHADGDGGGLTAARRWAMEIAKAGSGTVDWFDFRGLTRKDGKPVNDLNDCAVICEADNAKLEDLLP